MHIDYFIGLLFEKEILVFDRCPLDVLKNATHERITKSNQRLRQKENTHKSNVKEEIHACIAEEDYKEVEKIGHRFIPAEIR